MNIANAFPGSIENLPEELRIAQQSIDLPEVQEMLRRLSKYHLGICMPHMHDEQTGQFQPLPSELVQVEADLEVSFRPAEEIGMEFDRYIPVGWFWRHERVTATGACAMVCVRSTTGHYKKHKDH